MQLQLNIFSTNCNRTLSYEEFYTMFLHFRSLCYFINGFTEEGIGVDGGPKNLSVGGIPLASIMQDQSTVQKRTLANIVLSVYHKYLRNVSCLSSTREFSLTNQFLSNSTTIASSIDSNLPVVSFDINSQFCSSNLSGYIRSVGSNSRGRKCQVKNLYDANNKIENMLLLQTFDTCAALSPLNNPMWNIKNVHQYFDIIHHDEIVRKMVSMGAADRIQTLRRYAPMVAELNGWVEDKALSRINSSSHKPRKIFRSEKFNSPNYYLSIDYEKSDFVFELFNTSGEHQKEINWQGQKTGDGRADHNIRLHK